ncbi:MAG: hypothetical protein KTQ49_08800 [Candidatus Omnitrophica bacterium]|nr:hypothetical protein [Candidatus Omnitrophota bacterium]
MDNLKHFWDMVLAQRDWSWAVTGAAYLLVYLCVRHFFFHSLLKRAKALNSKWYQEIKKYYVKQCVGGWVLFLVSFLLFIFFWQSANLKQASLYEAAMVCLIVLSVLLSILSHLIAFAVSTVHVLKQLENNQMTF